MHVDSGDALLTWKLVCNWYVWNRGGATALIASIQPSVVKLGWRYVYIIAISSLIMIAWALIINVSKP